MRVFIVIKIDIISEQLLVTGNKSIVAQHSIYVKLIPVLVIGVVFIFLQGLY